MNSTIAKVALAAAGVAAVAATGLFIYKRFGKKPTLASVEIPEMNEPEQPVTETSNEKPVERDNKETSVVREPVKPEMAIEEVGGWILKALEELEYHEYDFIPLSSRCNTKIAEKVNELNPGIDKDYIYRILKDCNIISLQVFFASAAQEYGAPETIYLTKHD